MKTSLSKLVLPLNLKKVKFNNKKQPIQKESLE